MNETAPASKLLADLYFIAADPVRGRPGTWEVRHKDGTLLFSSDSEDAALSRLEQLCKLVEARIAVGHTVTGKDVLALWPATAPAPLLLSAERSAAQTTANV